MKTYVIPFYETVHHTKTVDAESLRDALNDPFFYERNVELDLRGLCEGNHRKEANEYFGTPFADLL